MKHIKRIACVAAVLIASGSPIRAQSAVKNAEKPGATFDFVETDIKMVLSALAEAARLNIVFGPMPSKPVTLRTSQPMNVAEIAAMMKSVAESNGAKMIVEGSMVRVQASDPVPPPMPPPQVAPEKPRQEDIHVYRLKHIPAAKAASVLQSLLGATVGTSITSSGRNSTLTDQLRSQRIPLAQSTPQAQMQQASGDHSGEKGSLFVVAEDLSNALLVRASPQEWEQVQRTIQLVDVRPLQVLIDVLIAEVRRSSNSGSGVEISVPNQRLESGGTIGGDLNTGTTGDFALNILQIGSIRADVALSALSAKSDISVLSRPVILAQNNTEARILVGSQRPFIQVQRALPTENAVRDQIIQYRDVGTSLTLTPTINPDGYVNLVISQEISNATSELQFGAPVISTREASTTMLVKDGQTAVIAGLIDRQQDKTKSGIPFLKDLPLIGFLFGARSKNSSATELFLFLTPHVIRTDNDVERIRQDVQENTDMLRKAIKSLPPFLPDSIR